MTHLPNIAFAGLTAAGKTTHARLLAEQLGYEYVSATEIILDIVGMADSAEGVWFTQFDQLQAAREGDAVDLELERRLLELAASRQGVVFDTWALAWICDVPIIRLWIESDLPSRIRKCFVSQTGTSFTLEECHDLVQRKDLATRESFLRRHSFDLFIDRQRYDAILDNSHLIPGATKDWASIGINRFSPVIREVVRALMTGTPCARDLSDSHPTEIVALSGQGWR